MSPRTSRTDPRLIRDVLAYTQDHGPVITARHFDVDVSTVYRWKGYRTEFGAAWPTDADIADYDAKAHDRSLNAARKRRYEARVYLNRGPILQDATGSIRRIRALCRMGWTQRQIGAQPELRVSPERISQFARGRHAQMTPETIKSITSAYRRLCRTIPSGTHADRARDIAAQKGWDGPGAWDDETIDNPATRPAHTRYRFTENSYIDEAAVLRRMGGERVHLTMAERVEVVRRLRAEQRSHGWIEDQTGLKAERYLPRARTLVAA